MLLPTFSLSAAQGSALAAEHGNQLRDAVYEVHLWRHRMTGISDYHWVAKSDFDIVLPVAKPGPQVVLKLITKNPKVRLWLVPYPSATLVPP